MRLARSSLAAFASFTLLTGCGDVARDVITGPGGTAGSPSAGASTGGAATGGANPGGAAGGTSMAGAAETGGSTCASNADCTPNDRPWCDPARHRCVECLSDGYCDPGERCSTEIGECAVPCDAGQACPADAALCDPVLGFCVECRDDGECPADFMCRNFECSRP